MLVEDLLALPVGTRVIGRIETGAEFFGAVTSLGNGSRLIRWDDGYVTIPLGKVREYDEYIAGHTRIDGGPRRYVRDDCEDIEEAVTAGSRKDFVR
jgi:hypothetical protein